MADIVDGIVGGAKQATNDYLKNQSEILNEWQQENMPLYDASTCTPYTKEEMEAEKPWLQKAFEKVGLWSDEDTYQFGTPMKCEPLTTSQLPPNVYDNSQVSISPNEQEGASVIANSDVAQKVISVIDTSVVKIVKNIGEEIKDTLSSEVSDTLGVDMPNKNKNNKKTTTSTKKNNETQEEDTNKKNNTQIMGKNCTI